MSGMDNPSASGDSGAERGDRPSDRNLDKNGERVFPGAPLDRPPAEEPTDPVRSWEEIREDKHKYPSQAEYEAVLEERQKAEEAQGPSDAPVTDSPDAAGVRETGERRTEAAEPSEPERSWDERSWDEIRADKAKFSSQREYEEFREAEKDTPPAKEDRVQAAADRDAGTAERERGEQERSDRDGERGDESGSRDETPAPAETRRVLPDAASDATSESGSASASASEEGRDGGAGFAEAGLRHADSPEQAEVPARADSDSSGLGFGEADAEDEGPPSEAGGLSDAARAGSDRGDQGDDGSEPGDAPTVVAGEVVRDSPREAGNPAAENVGEKERAGDIRADASGDEAETLRQEIASLKADNAHHKAEIEDLKSELSGLKSDISEIREALRGRDQEDTSDAPDAEESKPDGEGVLMHAHSEFHGEKLDLYTDGRRWRSGEALDEEQKRDLEDGRQGIADVPGVRDQGTDVIGERPDDESELPPDRKELLEADDSEESRADRLLDCLEDDEILHDLRDTMTDQGNAWQQALDFRPPTHTLQYHQDLPYMSATQQQATVGDMFSAVFVTSVALLEGGRRIRGMLSRKREVE